MNFTNPSAKFDLDKNYQLVLKWLGLDGHIVTIQITSKLQEGTQKTGSTEYHHPNLTVILNCTDGGSDAVFSDVIHKN